jgi:two-component system sensor histidine kinase CpxA
MMLGKLYIKIFLSFLFVLFVTEILILGLFSYSTRKSFRSRFKDYASSHATLVQGLIEERINAMPGTSIEENSSLRDLLTRLSDAYGVRIWLADSGGNALVKTFQEDIPEALTSDPKTVGRDPVHFKLRHHRNKGGALHTAIPIEIGEQETGSLHLVFDKMQPPHPEGRFALGLLGIGVVIALLLIPVSRLITERVKRLRHSALQIAEGDLSHRVAIKGTDEIGELGRSFNRMADKLETMIKGGRELTANISHELRSPLARISVAEELLREKWERGRVKDLHRHLDTIREDIEELDRLIDSILALSKLDLQQGPTKLETLNASELIGELLERFRPAMDRKGLHLTADLAIDSLVMGDKDDLRTALSNLLENAVKFTAANGKVTMKANSKRNSAEISITNSFKALSTEDLEKIFDPFYRIEGSRESGSGLGLAITRKIIERHGGSIEATNCPEGLEIKIRLPRGS